MWNLIHHLLMRKSKVVSRNKDINGKVKESYDPNHFLHTLTHDVKFPDGKIKQCSANMIAENECAQVDDDGYSV